MKLSLRPYQEDALRKTCDALDAGKNPLVKLPTGSGKSLLMAALIAKRRHQPTLVLTHVQELLSQNSAALRLWAPDIPQSFYSASLREKRGKARVVFGGVQSVVRSLPALGSRELILIDEAHMCPRETSAMYARCFAHFSLAQRCGFTATDQRLDSGSLLSGDDAWFDCMAHEEEVSSLIAGGWLLPLVGVMTEHQADLSSVSSRNGEYAEKEAEEAVSTTLTLSDVVKEAVYLARKRKHWLVFAAGKEHAAKVNEELLRRGVQSRVVLGDTPDDERSSAVDLFRSGSIRALVNVGVLTTGFDAPHTDCIISLRPTKSPVLWTQVLGRGMRLADEKKNCLLLDFVGNLERLGGVGCVAEVFDHRSPSVAAAARTARRKEEEKRERKIVFESASLADPMKSGALFIARVERVRVLVQNSRRFPGKQLSIVVYDLLDEMGRALQARSFVCLEYPGTPRRMAERWFERRGIAGNSVPYSVAAALPIMKAARAPSDVSARWDPRMKCYLVEDERF